LCACLRYRSVSVCSTAASSAVCYFFFFTDPATTEIYTLSLHDALPISASRAGAHQTDPVVEERLGAQERHASQPVSDHLPVRSEDRKSTRLNSSHVKISYAVFCLKKKKKTYKELREKKLQLRSVTHAP